MDKKTISMIVLGIIAAAVMSLVMIFFFPDPQPGLMRLGFGPPPLFRTTGPALLAGVMALLAWAMLALRKYSFSVYSEFYVELLFVVLTASSLSAGITEGIIASSNTWWVGPIVAPLLFICTWLAGLWVAIILTVTAKVCSYFLGRACWQLKANVAVN